MSGYTYIGNDELLLLLKDYIVVIIREKTVVGDQAWGNVAGEVIEPVELYCKNK